MSLAIRDAVEADIDPITRIYATHVVHGTSSFEVEPPSVEEMRRRLRAVTDRPLPILVADDAGEVVGYSYASPYRDRPAYRYTLEDSVYVADKQRGRGIGSSLVVELVGRCERVGCRQLIAVIGDSANGASIAAHARAGFVRVGLLTNVGWKHGRWLDVVLMQRSLGDGASTSPH